MVVTRVKPPVYLIDFNTTVSKTRLHRMFAIMTNNDIMTPRLFLLYLFLEHSTQGTADL